MDLPLTGHNASSRSQALTADPWSLTAVASRLHEGCNAPVLVLAQLLLSRGSPRPFFSSAPSAGLEIDTREAGGGRLDRGGGFSGEEAEHDVVSS